MILRKCICIVALCLLCLQASGQNSQLTITLSGGNSFRPGLYMDADGKPDGIYYDLWEVWSQKTGVKIEWRLMDWPKAILALLNGEVDAALGVSYTEERAMLMDFTEPYGFSKVFIYYPKDFGGIRNLNDLEGFPIGLLGGSIAKQKLKSGYNGRLIFIDYVNYPGLVEAIKAEKIHVFVAEENSMAYYLTRSQLTALFQRLPDPLYVGDLRVAVRKGDNKLLELLQNGLDLISEQDRKVIFDKWFGNDIPLHIPWREIGLGVLAAFILIGLLILWNMILKSRVQAATKSLRQSEEKFRELVEQSPLSMQVHELDGTMIMVNKAWAGLWGVSNVLKQIGRYNILKDPQLKELGYAKAFKKAIAGRSVDIPVSSYNPTRSKNPGRTIYTHVHLYPLKDTAGAVKNIVITQEDLTEKLTAEAEQKAMENRLRQGEKMEAIGQLAGGIAHDFNNMLAGIMGYAEVLAMSLEDADLKETAMGIVKAAKRSKALTDQLLAFARKGRYRNILVDMHKVVNEVISLLKHSIDKRIRLEVDLKAVPSFITGDPSQLQNALLNLAINACDAMPTGGELFFSTEVVTYDQKDCREVSEELKPGDYLALAVTDTGIGMAAEIQKKIFEPFFTTKAERKNIGMGLPAVYGTVKSHRGAITVQSETGKGTTFKISLPLVKGGDDTLGKEDASEKESVPSACYRMLVIDDESIVGEMIEKLLLHIGHSVKIFSNGREAIDYFRDNWRDVDAVILDLVMPDMSGREIFRALAGINPAVKVILSSGYSIDGEAQKILKEGALDFIQKPFSLKELAIKIKMAMGQQD